MVTLVAEIKVLSFVRHNVAELAQVAQLRILSSSRNSFFQALLLSLSIGMITLLIIANVFCYEAVKKVYQRESS